MSGVQIRRPILGEHEGSYVEVRIVWEEDQTVPRRNVTAHALTAAAGKALQEIEEVAGA